jgi:hypothetical protein
MIEFHPYADIFPLLSEEELESFAEDIKENGQHESIKMYEGKILDGRNRYLACIKAGVTPHFAEYEGTSPLNYSMSLNAWRRHMDKSQLAMAGAKLLTTKLGRPKSGSIEPLIDREGAAYLMGVGHSLITRARKILEVGTQKQIDDVSKGIRTVNEVYVLLTKKPREPSAPTILDESRDVAIREGYITSATISINRLIETWKAGEIADKIEKDALAGQLLELAQLCRELARNFGSGSHMSVVK